MQSSCGPFFCLTYLTTSSAICPLIFIRSNLSFSIRLYIRRYAPTFFQSMSLVAKPKSKVYGPANLSLVVVQATRAVIFYFEVLSLLEIELARFWFGLRAMFCWCLTKLSQIVYLTWLRDVVFSLVFPDSVIMVLLWTYGATIPVRCSFIMFWVYFPSRGGCFWSVGSFKFALRTCLMLNSPMLSSRGRLMRLETIGLTLFFSNGLDRSNLWRSISCSISELTNDY